MNANRAERSPQEPGNQSQSLGGGLAGVDVPASPAADQPATTPVPEQAAPAMMIPDLPPLEAPASTPILRATAAQTAVTAETAQVSDQVAAQMKEFRQDFESLRGRLDAVERAVLDTAKQISFIPPQVSMVGDKVDTMTTSISHGRCRSLLDDLLRIYDLTDQMLLTADAQDGPSRARSNLDTLRTQIGQILEVNGLTQIATQGLFDPTIHRAVRRVPCGEPSQSNQVFKVVRSGFRTERRVLRYAEVEVFFYDPKGALAPPETLAQPPERPEPILAEPVAAASERIGQTAPQL